MQASYQKKERTTPNLIGESQVRGGMDALAECGIVLGREAQTISLADALPERFERTLDDGGQREWKPRRQPLHPPIGREMAKIRAADSLGLRIWNRFFHRVPEGVQKNAIVFVVFALSFWFGTLFNIGFYYTGFHF